VKEDYRTSPRFKFNREKRRKTKNTTGGGGKRRKRIGPVREVKKKQQVLGTKERKRRKW